MDFEYCKTCNNRGFTKSQGLICGLTQNKPNYKYSCPDYSENKDELLSRQAELKYLERQEFIDSTGGLSQIGIKSPILAGIIITTVGLLINGYLLIYFQRISIWLIIILIAGIVVLFRGLIKYLNTRPMDDILD